MLLSTSSSTTAKSWIASCETFSRNANANGKPSERCNDGDSVVVNGNFLIDAESNLQSALKGLTATDKETHK